MHPRFATPISGGYWLVGSDGGVFSFGAPFEGAASSAGPSASPVVGMAYDPYTGGYWEPAANGDVLSFGGAPTESTGPIGGLVSPVVGIAEDPISSGYRLVAADGGVFCFGGAVFDGSMGGTRLNAPVVGMADDLAHGGYWEVASDGGVFAFGGAAFDGSMGGSHLNAPVVGMVQDPVTGGYWLVAADGGVFAFGGAAFHGSLAGERLNGPIRGMAVLPPTYARPTVGLQPTADGQGYSMAASDGTVSTFGDAPAFGYVTSLSHPLVSLVGTPDHGGFWFVDGYGHTVGFGDVGFEESLSPLIDSDDVVTALPGSGGDSLTWIFSDGDSYPLNDSPICESFIFEGPLVPPAPIRAAAVTSDFRGCWLLDGDGNVYASGDAADYGSWPGPDKPVFAPGRGAVGIAPTHDGHGYWLVDAQGAVVDLGDAPALGQPAHVTGPIAGITATPDGGGYWLYGVDGNVYAFGDAVNDGGTENMP